MTKQTNVNIRKIDNGWVYTIMEFDPLGGFTPKQEEFYADTLEDVFDQLRRKVGDQPVRKPIPYPLAPSPSGSGRQTAYAPYECKWVTFTADPTCNFAGWDTATPSEDYFSDNRTEDQVRADELIGKALCNVFGFSQDRPKEEPDVLSSFKEIWTEKK